MILTDLPDTGEAAGCFEKAVAYDLKINGKKVAGAAIRRNQRGFLLQGSIQRVTIPVRFETILANAIGDQIFRSGELNRHLWLFLTQALP